MKARLLLALACALGTFVATAPPAVAVEPVVVVDTDKPEQAPAASSTYVAWVVYGPHFHANVWAQATGGDAPFRVNPDGTSAFTGGIEGSTLLYQRSTKDEKPDLVMVDLSTQSELDVPDGVNTSAAEFEPSISATHLLFGRGIPHGGSVVLFDIATGTSQVLYSKTHTERRLFFVFPSQVNGNYAVWETFVLRKKNGQVVDGDVWLHDIAAEETTKIPAGEGIWQYGPSVDTTGTMFFGRSNFRCGENVQLIERQIDGTESVLYALPGGRDFAYSDAVANADGTADVYVDIGSCRGTDFGDIVKLPGV